MGDNSASARYQLGYQACAQEVSKYLDSNSDEEVELKTKLLNHLANCVTSDAFPSHPSSSPSSSGLPGMTGPAGFSLVASVSSSIPEKQDAFLLPSSMTSLPASSMSSSVIPSTLITPTPSDGNRLTSPLPRFLCSSSSSSVSSSSGGIPGSGAAPSVIIPIPISPLSIGTVSPASLTSGILTPEKQRHHPHSGSQIVGSGHTNNSTAHSLDLSAVRISDTALFKTCTFSQTPSLHNIPVVTSETQVPKTLSLLPPAVSTALTNARTVSEVNNNVIAPHLANENHSALEKAVGMITVSSPEVSDSGQKRNSFGFFEANSTVNNMDKSSDNINNNNNNINNNDYKLNVNNTLTVPTFVNLSSNAPSNERAPQVMQINQPQLLQLLQQQQEQKVPLSQTHMERNQQQPQLMLPSADALLNANTGIIANMNQLQLVPTKTASGEIALVLSTGLINPAPPTLGSNPQANFAIPLHLPPATSLSQTVGLQQPLPASRPVQISTSTTQPNTHGQERRELSKLHPQQNQHIELDSTSPTNSQSFREPSTPPQKSSVFMTPGNESEQVAPLNLTSPNHKASTLRPQEMNMPHHSGLLPPPLSIKAHPDQISGPTAAVAAPTLPVRTTTNTSQKEHKISDPNSQGASPGYSPDRHRPFGNLSNPQTSLAEYSPTSSLSLPATRRVLELGESERLQPYQVATSPPMKPGIQNKTPNLDSGHPSDEFPPGFASDSYRIGGHLSARRHSPSPPVAHSSGETRRYSCSDAGKPLRHGRGRTLFRPW